MSRLVGGDWEQIEDASYCTRIPAATAEPIVQRIAAAIMERVYDHAYSGRSIKRTCEELSWLTAQDAPADKYDWEVTS